MSQNDPQLSEADKYHVMAAQMRLLKTSEGWDGYVRLLEDAENGWIHRLLTGDKDNFDYNKGFIEGLRKAYALPDEIITISDRFRQNL